jgi:hypothetical protein
MKRRLTVVLSAFALVAAARAQSPFASAVVRFDPAPGQWVNDSLYNDPAKALGAPLGDDPCQPNNNSLVSLGGFGGALVLAFDHTVMDDPANPFGLDAIAYGNSLWVAGNPNRRWAECGVIEISRDANANGLADDTWYLIPGTHIAPEPSQHEIHTWDDDIADPTWPPFFPPADEGWIPPGHTGTWTTEGYRLPDAVFAAIIVANPDGPAATTEGIWGYADYTPTQALPPGQSVETFYTRPDDPFVVGLTSGCGGGDGFDIAWAVDPNTWEPAELDGFDFVRVRTGVDWVPNDPNAPPLGELSTELDAVADVAEGTFGDAENDGDIDWDDFAVFAPCWSGPEVAVPSSPCRVMDFDQDRDVDLLDWAEFQAGFGRL